MKNRWRFVFGLLALVLVDFLQLLVPRVIKHAIDDLTAGEIAPFRLLVYGGEIFCLALGIGGFRYVWRYLLLGASRRIERALRERLFLHLQRLSVSYFQRTKVGDLMAHATNDIEAVRMAIGLGLVFLVDTVLLGMLTLLFMIYIHPELTFYAALPMPWIALLTLFFSRLIHQRFEKLQKTFSNLTERVRESIAGIRLVKAYVLEEREKEKVSLQSMDYVRNSLHVTRIWGMFFPLLLFFSNLSMVIALYLGGRFTILQTISTGDFVAFMSYIGTLTWPMMALGWAVNMIQRGGASLERINRILREIPEIRDISPSHRSVSLKGKVEFRSLTFRPAPDGRPILQGIDLTFQEGERIVLAGRTGSGKTTLCRLLARVLEPPADTVFLDGMEIHQIPLRVLRGAMGYVPQDTLLFSDTVRENIAFGKIDATDREIEQAARIAQIWDEIMEFPNGLQTRIGEKGVTLSGGQKQRIAIARAILTDSPLFLLDDALSSVDIHTEERILEGLETFLAGKTCVMITHRVAFFRRADRIIVLDEGRVAETGRHDDLLARGGIYAGIYHQRQIEEEIEKERVPDLP